MALLARTNVKRVTDSPNPSDIDHLGRPGTLLIIKDRCLARRKAQAQCRRGLVPESNKRVILQWAVSDINLQLSMYRSLRCSSSEISPY